MRKISYIYKNHWNSFYIPERFEVIINKIESTAKSNGYKVYLVGGFVRDLILGREPKDLDIMAVRDYLVPWDKASPGIELAGLVAREWAPEYYPVVFPRFGTAQVTIDNELVEFVMPRKEYYTDESRKPDTQIGSLEQDALRRDFSINALFLPLDGHMMDLTKHGLEDLENKKIQVTDISNVDVIFHQDPLRLMRSIRLAIQLDFEIAPETKLGIQNNAERIQIISNERIRDELIKILVSKKPSVGFKHLKELGILKYILPEIEDLKIDQTSEYHHKDVFDHTLQVVDNIYPELGLRLAALFHDVGKPKVMEVIEGRVRFIDHDNIGGKITEEVMDRLKFPRSLVNRVKILVAEHMYPHGFSDSWSDAAIRRFLRNLGPYVADILLLAGADMTSMRPEVVEKLTEQMKAFQLRIIEVGEVKPISQIKDLLTGNELMTKFGHGPGKWIKEIKDELMDQQMENPNLTKEEAWKLAEIIIKVIPKQMFEVYTK